MLQLFPPLSERLRKGWSEEVREDWNRTVYQQSSDRQTTPPRTSHNHRKRLDQWNVKDTDAGLMCVCVYVSGSVTGSRSHTAAIFKYILVAAYFCVTAGNE